MLARVRRIAGIRTLAELPSPKVQSVGTIRREGYSVEKLILKPEPEIWLPALRFVADRPSGEISLCVHQDDKAALAAPGGTAESLVKAGQTVLAVDLRGIGETQQTKQARGFFPGLRGDPQDVYTAYQLGRSYGGIRAEDILVCARWLAERAGKDRRKPLHLVAVGHVGIPALHAAALEPELFASVKLVRVLSSWADVVHSRVTENQLVSAVHGALKSYDLPDLCAVLGKKLVVEQPVDARGRPK